MTSTQCWELTGNSNSRNQQRDRCKRTATIEVLWQGEWRPVCGQHAKRDYPHVEQRPLR